MGAEGTFPPFPQGVLKTLWKRWKEEINTPKNTAGITAGGPVYNNPKITEKGWEQLVTYAKGLRPHDQRGQPQHQKLAKYPPGLPDWGTYLHPGPGADGILPQPGPAKGRGLHLGLGVPGLSFRPPYRDEGVRQHRQVWGRGDSGAHHRLCQRGGQPRYGV